MIVSRFDPDTPRALVVGVPITKIYKGSQYEVQMPRVPWLPEQSYANVQGIGSFETIERIRRVGKFEAAALIPVKAAIRWALDL
jgi:mRNA interferase MazF